MNINTSKATAFLTSQPILAAAIQAADPAKVAQNPFASDVLAKLVRYGSLSDRQVSALLNALQRASQPAEVKVPAVTGKAVAITGEVVSVKWHEDRFSRSRWGAGSYKMTVKVASDAGIYLVWGSVPSGEGIEKDMHISFVADVEASDKDASFAFFKRPRKAQVLGGHAAPIVYPLDSPQYEGLNPFKGGEEAGVA